MSWFDRLFPLRNPFAKQQPLPEHLRRGREAERLAEEWLNVHLGWRCRYRNWRFQKGEIDLIGVLPDGQWVFVEVRSRQETARVSGYHSITRAKKKLLRQTIDAFLRRLPVVPPWRFDVVDVAWRVGQPPTLRHFAAVRTRR